MVDDFLWAEHKNKINPISIPGSCGDCIHSIHLLNNYFVRIGCTDRVKIYFPYEYQVQFYFPWLQETKIPYEIGTLEQYNPILKYSCYGTKSIKKTNINKNNLSVSKRLNNTIGVSDYTSFRCMYLDDFIDICELFAKKTKLKIYDICKVENLGEPVGYNRIELKDINHMADIMNSTFISITELTMLYNASYAFNTPLFCIFIDDGKYAFTGGSSQFWNPCSRCIIINSTNELSKIIKNNKSKIMELVDEISDSQIKDINEHSKIENTPSISCSLNTIKQIEQIKKQGLFPDLNMKLFERKDDALILSDNTNIMQLFQEIYNYIDGYTYLKLLLNRGFDKINVGTSYVGSGKSEYNWNQFYHKQNYNAISVEF